MNRAWMVRLSRDGRRFAVGLFSFAPGGNLVTPYDSMTPDGRRFLLSKLVQHGGETPLTVLVDWPAQLRTRATQ